MVMGELYLLLIDTSKYIGVIGYGDKGKMGKVKG